MAPRAMGLIDSHQQTQGTGCWVLWNVRPWHKKGRNGLLGELGRSVTVDHDGGKASQYSVVMMFVIPALGR